MQQKNRIIYLNAGEAIRYDNDTFAAVINGALIRSESDWLYTLAESFHFPVPDRSTPKFVPWYEGAYSDRKYCLNWAGFNDWMTDLSWINENKIALYITGYDKMHDGEGLLKYFENEVLHFWEYDAETVIVEGKFREFNVYCIKG